MVDMGQKATGLPLSLAPSTLTKTIKSRSSGLLIKRLSRRVKAFSERKSLLSILISELEDFWFTNIQKKKGQI